MPEEPIVYAEWTGLVLDQRKHAYRANHAESVAGAKSEQQCRGQTGKGVLEPSMMAAPYMLCGSGLDLARDRTHSHKLDVETNSGEGCLRTEIPDISTG